MSRTYGTGRVIGAEQDCVWVPRTMTRRYVVVAFHGAPGVAATGLTPDTTPGWFGACLALRNAGCVVVQADWDLQAWGGDTLLGHIETFRTGLATLLTTLDVPGRSVLDSSKLVIFSGSMGGANGFRYQEQYPTRVAGHAGIAPVSDLTGYYTGTYRWGSDQGTTYQANIGTAYGVTYPTALPASADMYDNAALITSPTWIGYSTADTTVPAAQNQAMATALGSHATAVQVSTSALHGDAETLAALGFGLTDWLIGKAS